MTRVSALQAVAKKWPSARSITVYGVDEQTFDRVSNSRERADGLDLVITEAELAWMMGEARGWPLVLESRPLERRDLTGYDSAKDRWL